MPANIITKTFKTVTPSYLLKLFILFCLYFFTARLGLTLDAVSGFATAVWAPTGISLAFLLLYGYKYWPGIFLAALTVNYLTGAPFIAALGIGTGNTLESVIAVYAFLKVESLENIGRTVRSNTYFILTAAFFGPFVSAFIGVLSLKLTGVITNNSLLLPTFATWWTGDALGGLTVAPAIILCEAYIKNFKNILVDNTISSKLSNINYHKILEFLILLSIFLFLYFVIFWDLLYFGTHDQHILYFLLIPLIWISIRYKPVITALGTLAVSILTIYATVQGKGPFVTGSLSESLLFLQIFIGVSTFMSLILSASIKEQEELAERLRKKIFEYQKQNKTLEITKKNLIEAGEQIMIEKLKANEEKSRLETTLTSIGDAVVVVDNNYQIILMNKVAENLCGYKLAEALNKHYNKILVFNFEKTPEEKYPSIIENVIKSGINSDLQNHALLIRKDGKKIPIANSVAAIKDVNGGTLGCVLVIRDVTKERELEKAKDNFLSIAAHQLRTPLTSIKWNLENVFGLRMKAELKNILEKIDESNERMISLVNDLLEAARIDQGRLVNQPKNINVYDVINKVIESLKFKADKKKINIQTTYAIEPPPTIYLDPTRFYSVIENIVSNALEYNIQNGHVYIKIEKIDEGSNIKIAVEDTGIGIPLKDQRQVFTRFFRAPNSIKAKTKGNGLGLFAAKSYITNWGGTITFKSEENKGTKFSITLPVNKITSLV